LKGSTKGSERYRRTDRSSLTEITTRRKFVGGGGGGTQNMRLPLFGFSKKKAWGGGLNVASRRG